MSFVNVTTTIAVILILFYVAHTFSTVGVVKILFIFCSRNGIMRVEFR